MPQSTRTALRALSLVVAAVPFVFALIRAVRTGDDLRYLWVGIAGVCGAVATLWVAGPDGGSPKRAVTLSGITFAVVTILGTLTAVLLGTTLGPGVVIVGASFGICFGVSAGFLALASPRAE